MTNKINVNYEFDKKFACAITGHRFLPSDFDKNILKSDLIYLINSGFTTFNVGMAIGFDTEVCKYLLELKKDYGIKIVACIPFNNQNEKFNKIQKLDYLILIGKCDAVYVLNREYDKYCYFERNRFMVDNSSAVYAYINYSKGGTYQTVKYAETKGVKLNTYGFSLQYNNKSEENK